MDFLSRASNFIIENFRSDDSSEEVSISDRIAQKFVEKLLVGENFLEKYGFPFKIRSSNIDKLRIVDDIDSDEGETKPRVEVEEISLQILPETNESVKKQSNCISMGLLVTIGKANIDFVDENGSVILNLRSGNIIADLSEETNSSVSISDLTLVSHDYQVFEIPNLKISVNKELNGESFVESANIKITKGSISDVMSMFSNISLQNKITFSSKKLTVMLQSSTLLTFNDVKISVGGGLSLVASLIHINMSSYNFNVHGFSFEQGRVKIEDFSFESRYTRFEKLENSMFLIADINEDKTISLTPFRVTIPLNRIERAKSILHDNSFISLLVDSLSTSDFSIAPVIFELVFVVGSDNVSMKQKVSLRRKEGTLYLKLNDMEMRVNKGYPIYSDYEVSAEYGDEITINLKDIKIMMLTTEIPPLAVLIKDYYKKQDKVIEKKVNIIRPEKFIVEVCVEMETVGKKPIFRQLVKFNEVKVTTLKENVSLNLSFLVMLSFIDYGTSKENVIIAPTHVDMCIPLSKNSQDFSVKTSKVKAFLWMKALNYLKNIIQKPTIVPQAPTLLINETSQTLVVTGETGDKLELKPQQKMHCEFKKITVSNGENSFSSSIKNISYSILIWKNCVVSVSSKDTTKYIRFTPLYMIENRLSMRISLFTKSLISRAKLFATMEGESRTPINPLEAGESYLLCIGDQYISKAHTFEIDPNERKNFHYMLIGPDCDCPIFISFFRDSLTKTMIILIQPKLSITNMLYKEIVFGVTDPDGKQKNQASRTLQTGASATPSITTSMSKRLQLRISDAVNGTCTEETLFDIEDGSKKELILGSDILTVKIKDTIDSTNITIYCGTYVNNQTLQNVVLVSETGTFSVPSNAKVMLPEGDYSLKTFSKDLVPIEVSNSTIVQRQDVCFDICQDVIINTYTEGLTKHIIIKEKYIVKNETDKYITISSTSEQKLNVHEVSSIRLNTTGEGCTISYGSFKSTGRISLLSPCYTTVQLLSDTERVFLDITTIEEDETMITIIENAKCPPRFAIINETDFNVFAQQLEDIMPLMVVPHSSSMFGFDVPDISNSITLTLEGVSANVDFSELQFNSIFPCKIAKDYIYISVMSESNGTRVIKIKNTEEKKKIDNVSVVISIPSVNLTLLKNTMESFAGILLTDINVSFAISHLAYLSKWSIKDIQIDDHDNKTVIFKNLDSMFIDLAMQFSLFPPSFSALTWFTLSISNLELSCIESTLYSLIKYYSSIRELIKINKPEINLFLIHSSMNAIKFKCRIENGFENSTRQISGLKNLLPLYASYSIPEFNFESFSGPFHALDKIIRSYVSSAVDNTVKASKQLPSTSCTFSLPVSLIENFTQESKSEDYMSFKLLDKEWLTFNGFIKDENVEKQEIEINSKVKVYNPQETKDIDTVLKFAISSQHMATKKKDFHFGTVISPQNLNRKVFANAKQSKIQKRGKLRTTFMHSEGTIGIFAKAVVVANKTTKKVDDFSYENIKNVARDGDKISVSGVKPKDPSFSVIINDNSDAENLFNILNSISVATNNSYEVTII